MIILRKNKMFSDAQNIFNWTRSDKNIKDDLNNLNQKRLINLSQKTSVTKDPNNQLTSKDLAIENLRMQRQRMINRNTSQKIQAQKDKAQLQQLTKLQKLEDDKNDKEIKNQIDIKNSNNSRDEAKNVGLYKTRSKMPNPVPMKT